MEIRIVFNTTGTRDMYVFKYTWDESKLDAEYKWSCEDGYVEGAYKSYPHLFWQTVPKTKFNVDTLELEDEDVSIDSFHGDIGQDCVILHSDSSITIDEITGKATFVVTFKRQLQTRGIINDVVLTQGKAIELDYGVAYIYEEEGTDYYAP